MNVSQINISMPWLSICLIYITFNRSYISVIVNGLPVSHNAPIVSVVPSYRCSCRSATSNARWVPTRARSISCVTITPVAHTNVSTLLSDTLADVHALVHRAVLWFAGLNTTDKIDVLPSDFVHQTKWYVCISCYFSTQIAQEVAHLPRRRQRTIDPTQSITWPMMTRRRLEPGYQQL